MNAREAIKTSAYYAMGAATRVRALIDRQPYFWGAFPTYELAQAALPMATKSGYNSDDMVEIAMDTMMGVSSWDYPIMFWLERLIRERDGISVLDAGGHIGTKHHAFEPYLELEKADWTIWDLPALLRAGRAAQNKGIVSKDINFVETPHDAGKVDLLLASGLFQFIDISFEELLDRMAERPRWVMLNKVATRHDADIVTLQLIGKKRVPYQIRDRKKFEGELKAAGYAIRDSWTIAGLSHRIGTHPWLGESESKGYFLERV